MTFKTYYKWRVDTFSAPQIDCTPPYSQMRAGKHQTGASHVFFNRQLGPATSSAIAQVAEPTHRLTVIGLRYSFFVSQYTPLLRFDLAYRSDVRHSDNSPAVQQGIH